MAKRKIVVLSGAGISKPSGIPTYIEMDAEFKYRSISTRTKFEKNPILYYKQLKQFINALICAEPNLAHKCLVKDNAFVEKIKYDIPIITMNVDNLHEEAGSNKVIHLHGDMQNPKCPNCGYNISYSKIIEEIEINEDIVYCPKCKNDTILQPNVVLYEDSFTDFTINNEKPWKQAVELIKWADVIIKVGISNTTNTSNELLSIANYRGVHVFEINHDCEKELPLLLKQLINGTELKRLNKY